MPESVQCRICLKGDVLGVRGVMLICGLCKRPTHHSCLTPPMPEAQLKMILRATLARDAPKIGHPRIWLCPRCMKRNPEAAKETVIERSKTGVGTAPPSSSRAPTTVSLSRQGSIVKAPTPKSDEVMIIDDDDLVEVVQPQAKAAAKSQSTPSTQVVLVSSDDDIQVIHPPPLKSSASMRAGAESSQAEAAKIAKHSSATALVKQPAASELLISQIQPAVAGSSSAPASRHYDSGRPGPSDAGPSTMNIPIPRPEPAAAIRMIHPLPPKPDFGPPNANGLEKKPKRSRPGWRYAASSSDSSSPRVPHKKRRKEPGTKKTKRATLPTLPAEPAPLPDIRAIQQRLREEGKLAPPPTNFYEHRHTVQTTPPIHVSEEIHPRRPIPRMPSDSDMEDLSTVTAKVNRDKGKGKASAFAPLFMSDSESSSDGRRFLQGPKKRIDKGKGRARLEEMFGEKEAVVMVKQEDHDADGFPPAAPRPRSRQKNFDPDKGLLADWIRERQQALEITDQRDEWDKLLANRKFRLVEKHESGVLAPRKPEIYPWLQGKKREDEGVQWISDRLHKLHMQKATATVKRKIPEWML